MHGGATGGTATAHAHGSVCMRVVDSALADVHYRASFMCFLTSYVLEFLSHTHTDAARTLHTHADTPHTRHGTRLGGGANCHVKMLGALYLVTIGLRSIRQTASQTGNTLLCTQLCAVL